MAFATACQQRYLHLYSELIDRRVCDGCVIDGHGDLRPEHIYLGPTKPHVIDCIEFNAEYRQNDIIDELAFLAMECDRLGAPRIGQAVIAEYMEASRDRPPTSLVAFYKSYRACVRAKVATLRSEQQRDGAGLRSQQEAEDYLKWATEYARHLGRQLVIIVGGLMGTGKSTLATALKEPLAAELMRTDMIREELFRRNGDTAFGEGKYSPACRNQVYTALVDRLGKELAAAPTVILDGTFASQGHRARACRTARDLGATVLQVQCVCPESVALRRISERTAEEAYGSEGRAEIYQQHAATYESPLGGEMLVQVDTTQSIAEQVNEVITRIREIIRL